MPFKRLQRGLTERVRRLSAIYLRLLAPFKLRRHGARIIGITGSIGKSSTKAATVAVLRSRFLVGQSTPDYNRHLGLLLSLFHQRAGKSARDYLAAMAGATRDLLGDCETLDELVLEMGVDGPGEMSKILRVFRPQIAVFTGVAPVHIAAGQFADEEAIFEEKAKLVRSVDRGTVILNRDNPYCRRLGQEGLRARRLWYGRAPGPEEEGSPPPGLYFDRVSQSSQGLTVDLHVSPSSSLRAGRYTLTCPILGRQHVYVLLPAILVGMVAGLDLEECCKALERFSLPPGRMGVIAGIRSCTILDSSFNASPRAVEAALRTLAEYPAQRRIALLGSMNELGDASEAAHRAIGRLVPAHAHMLFTVGTEATRIAEAARAEGMPDSCIRSFSAAEEAGACLSDVVREGDVVLVKGSQQGIRLERAIRMMMKEPERAAQLLVRQ